MKYVVTITIPGTDQAAVVRRLRAFLKAAWRQWRIRAVAIVPELTDEKETANA